MDDKEKERLKEVSQQEQDIKKMAIDVHDYYRALIHEGFSEDQAFVLTSGFQQHQCGVDALTRQHKFMKDNRY